MLAGLMTHIWACQYNLMLALPKCFRSSNTTKYIDPPETITSHSPRTLLMSGIHEHGRLDLIYITIFHQCLAM